MTTEYGIFPQIEVNLLIYVSPAQYPPVQFMALDYTLCPNSQSIVIFLEHSLVPQRTVYVPRVQFMSAEYSLCPPENSLCP